MVSGNVTLAIRWNVLGAGAAEVAGWNWEGLCALPRTVDLIFPSGCLQVWVYGNLVLH